MNFNIFEVKSSYLIYVLLKEFLFLVIFTIFYTFLCNFIKKIQKFT